MSGKDSSLGADLVYSLLNEHENLSKETIEMIVTKYKLAYVKGRR